MQKKPKIIFKINHFWICHHPNSIRKHLLCRYSAKRIENVEKKFSVYA